MNLEEEKEWLAKAKNDPQAFAKLYEENYAKIFGYVLNRVADVEMAEDITAETFLRALKNLWQFRWRNIPFSAWLYRLASHEIANFFRKKKPTVSLELWAEPEDKTDFLEEIIRAQEELRRHADFLKLQEKIRRLPSDHQEVITLKFFEKKRIKEIALILGKKEGTVKSLIHRGLLKLKEEFEQPQGG